MAAVAPSVGPPARVITIAGGRGGIGKSMVAAQLAWAFSDSGRRVVLVDLDLAGPRQHVLVGASEARPGLAALVGQRRDPDEPPEPLLCQTRHPNLSLIAGGDSAMPPSALTPAIRLLLAQRLWSLPVDVVVVDVGAGIGYDPVDLLELGHHRLLVSSCHPNAVQDAFGLLRTAVARVLQRHLGRAGQLGLLEPAVRTRDGERMSEILARVQMTDIALHAAIVRDLVSFGGALIGTLVPDVTQLGTLQTMSRMAAEYLGVAVPLLGWLRAGDRMPELPAPRSRGASGADAHGDEIGALLQIGETLLAGPVHAPAAIHGALVAAAPIAAAARSLPPPLPPEALASRPVSVSAGTPPPETVPPIPRTKPVVYVRPPRKRRVDPQRAAPPPAEQGSGRQRVGLPGMTPRRVRS